MNRQQALNQLRIMQAWHEEFGDGPNADYDAICYAINIIEAQSNGLDTLIKAMEAEHKKLREMQKAQPEIIRCKDCKYCVYTPATPNANRQSEGHNPERWNCYLYLHEHHPAITPNDFCSKAERRTDG